MTFPSRPGGYDTSKLVSASRRDCLIGVGFDRRRGNIPRFIGQLHYRSSTDPDIWKEIAQFDHNETSQTGHDIYREGLHVDVARRTSSAKQLRGPHGTLDPNRGVVIRGYVDYFQAETAYFIDVYEERRSPGDPPTRSDGGDPTRSLSTLGAICGRMSWESAPSNVDILTVNELTELIADATDTTLGEIDRRAAAMDFGSPEEAATVD